eukprot:jgi/Mesvir1/14527/Mv05220-RA.2
MRPSVDLGIDVNSMPRGCEERVLSEHEMRKKKLALFEADCSRIEEGLYIGGDAVARNRDILRGCKISHVLNCAGPACPEYYAGELQYKTLWMLDTNTEDLLCILYDAFDYIESARASGGSLLVHCSQGVSRSPALVVAYLMWKRGLGYDDAYARVKASRAVANPNIGFACQLLHWQKTRCHLQVNPLAPVTGGLPSPVPRGMMPPTECVRIQRIAPHSSYDPSYLVAKALSSPSLASLDARGAFLVESLPLGSSPVYVWYGAACRTAFLWAARVAADHIVRYERGGAGHGMGDVTQQPFHRGATWSAPAISSPRMYGENGHQQEAGVGASSQASCNSGGSGVRSVVLVLQGQEPEAFWSLFSVAAGGGRGFPASGTGLGRNAGQENGSSNTSLPMWGPRDESNQHHQQLQQPPAGAAAPCAPCVPAYDADFALYDNFVASAVRAKRFDGSLSHQRLSLSHRESRDVGGRRPVTNDGCRLPREMVPTPPILALQTPSTGYVNGAPLAALPGGTIQGAVPIPNPLGGVVQLQADVSKRPAPEPAPAAAIDDMVPAATTTRSTEPLAAIPLVQEEGSASEGSLQLTSLLQLNKGEGLASISAQDDMADGATSPFVPPQASAASPPLLSLKLPLAVQQGLPTSAPSDGSGSGGAILTGTTQPNAGSAVASTGPGSSGITATAATGTNAGATTGGLSDRSKRSPDISPGSSDEEGRAAGGRRKTPRLHGPSDAAHPQAQEVAAAQVGSPARSPESGSPASHQGASTRPPLSPPGGTYLSCLAREKATGGSRGPMAQETSQLDQGGGLRAGVLAPVRGVLPQGGPGGDPLPLVADSPPLLPQARARAVNGRGCETHRDFGARDLMRRQGATPGGLFRDQAGLHPGSFAAAAEAQRAEDAAAVREKKLAQAGRLPRLFTYPHLSELTMFDSDDLDSQSLFFLLVPQGAAHADASGGAARLVEEVVMEVGLGPGDSALQGVDEPGPSAVPSACPRVIVWVGAEYESSGSSSGSDESDGDGEGARSRVWVKRGQEFVHKRALPPPVAIQVRPDLRNLCGRECLTG